MMSANWVGHYRDNILKLLPADGSKVRAKEVYRKSPFTSVTTKKYLGILTKEGSIQRIQESQKTVYYKRREKKRLENLIEDFTKEIELSLLSLSTETWQEGLKKRNLPQEEIDEIINDETQVGSQVLTAIIVKVHELLRKVIPNPFGHVDFCVRTYGKHVMIVPKQPSNSNWSIWER